MWFNDGVLASILLLPSIGRRSMEIMVAAALRRGLAFTADRSRSHAGKLAVAPAFRAGTGLGYDSAPPRTLTELSDQGVGALIDLIMLM